MIEDVKGEKLVKGFKSIGKSKTDFREIVEDISIIEESEVITYLPIPKLNDGYYVFPSDVNFKDL